jgi:glucosamine 6-phosphate synthetase-like amidotransferase/phosphosugar isomerase protein
VEGLVLWATSSTSPLLSPILEVLPLQMAAYRLAEWKGITPGAFRFVGQVTRSETGFARDEGS